jgi:hypothetical protein
MPKNPFEIKIYDPYAKPKKRISVRTSDKKHLLDYQNGKCNRCKKSFKQMKVRPILHHKNLNPKDNRITNMILVCSNCHDKIHQKQQNVRVKTKDAFGYTTYKVVKRGVKKKSKKKIQRKRKPTNPFEIKMPVYKPPKFKF